MCAAQALFAMASVSSMAGAMSSAPPSMGWRSWNAFKLDINDGRVMAQAKALVQHSRDINGSLSARGYRSVGIDDGWQACGAGVNGTFHDAAGQPLVNRSRFPDIGALNARVHARWSGQESLASG